MGKGTENTGTLVIFNQVVGDFFAKSPKSDAALKTARTVIGDVEWKKGFTEEKAKQVLAMLAAEGVYPIMVTGSLKRVYEDETKDGQGNTYLKVRIILEDPLETIVVSLDAGVEVTSIILQALCNVEPGEVVTFVTSQETASRGGRTYYNHRCKIVRADGKIVPQLAGAWRHAQDAANDATEALVAMKKPSMTKTIIKLANDAKIEFHLGLLRTHIVPRFR